MITNIFMRIVLEIILGTEIYFVPFVHKMPLNKFELLMNALIVVLCFCPCLKQE
jgi:hypothetical protein